MHPSRRARFAVAIGASTALLAAGGGITYATTAASPPTDDYAIGCSSSHHALRLINSDGSCPAGYTRIDVAAAPTHLTGSQAVPLATPTGKSVTVNQLTMEASCWAGHGADLDFTDTAGVSYDVHGMYFVNGSSPGKLNYYDNGGNRTSNQTGTGAGHIGYHENSANRFSYLALDQGEVDLNLIVTHNGHTLTVQAYLQVSASDCRFQAQVSPSS